MNYRCRIYTIVFFFFQAEDGIRDYKVTGVQTCALPILDRAALPAPRRRGHDPLRKRHEHRVGQRVSALPRRSEERRVGKECRCRWSADYEEGKEIEAEMVGTGKRQNSER